jgi:hypothetical protein
MIIKLNHPLPLRLKSPIINNVIARTKYVLVGIKEDYVVGGISLPTNEKWKSFYKKTHLKYVSNNRLLTYQINDDHLIGLKYFGNIKCWSFEEIEYVEHIINEETNFIINKIKN